MAILLGVTGSIAAYKACYLVRLLKKKGKKVTVVMTPFATRFVSKMTFAALSGSPVFAEFEDEKEPFTHLHLARTHNVFIIAPCDANTLSKIASGIGDNVLTTIALAFQGPLFLAPAMNSHMWENAVVQENIRKLEARGVFFFQPTFDLLACEEEGFGKMAEPEEIVRELEKFLEKKESWKGRRVLISAGATREFLDEVRFISNGSSGKMGYCLAQEAKRRGAEVFVVAGATEISFHPFPHTRVLTSQEMKKALLEKKDWADVILMAAAVADFTLEKKREKKIERQKSLTLKLVPTEDILLALTADKKNSLVVGFCLEEKEKLLKKAEEKLTKKNLDLIIGNPLESMHADKTEAIIVSPDKKVRKLGIQSKKEIARAVFDELELLPGRQK